MIRAWLRSALDAARRRVFPLSRWLLPARYAASVLDLTAQDLRADGIRGIILDLDNTVVPWGASAPAPEVVRWVAGLKEAGLAVCIVSNSLTSRARQVGAALGVPVVPRAAKPAPWAFRRAMRAMGTDPPHTALVGDQLFTDILGGNLVGLRTVLVDPLSSREFITTRVVRRLEAVVRRLLRQSAGGRGNSSGDPGRGGPD